MTKPHLLPPLLMLASHTGRALPAFVIAAAATSLTLPPASPRQPLLPLLIANSQLVHHVIIVLVLMPHARQVVGSDTIPPRLRMALRQPMKLTHKNMVDDTPPHMAT